MWPSVRLELDIFCGLLPLQHSDWRAPFSCTVHPSDASEEAWGFGHIDLGQQRGFDKRVACGRKTRFRRVNAIPPRTPRIRSRSGWWDPSGQRRGRCGASRLRLGGNFRVGSRTINFAEISPTRWHESLWTVRCSAPWPHPVAVS